MNRSPSLVWMMAVAALATCSAEPAHPAAQAVTRASAPAHVYRHHHRRAAAVARPASQAQSWTPAEPQVTLTGQALSVQGDGAPLRQVLDRIAQVGKMEVSGTIPYTPVHGTFGPGAPEAVLADLLQYADCSYVLGGRTATGLPHTVVLLGSIPGTASAAPTQAASSMPEEPQATSAAQTSEDESAAQPVLGPGAVAHVPPNEQGNADSPEQAPQRVQQNLQRLQQIEEQQESQQPQHP